MISCDILLFHNVDPWLSRNIKQSIGEITTDMICGYCFSKLKDPT